MDIKTVFAELASALSGNEEILTWLNTNFGVTSLKIYIGIDPENYPSITDDAAVYLVPGSRSRTRGDAYRQHTISIVCFIKDESKTVEGSIETLNSIGMIDDFTNLVEKCAFNKLQSLSIAVTSLAGESDEIYYPVARAELAYSIEIPSRI